MTKESFVLSYLELVELANGDIVLQKAESDEKPLLVIQFSDETRRHITGSCLEVARAMVQAGLEAAAVMDDEAALHAEEEDEVDTLDMDTSKTLH